MPGAPVVCADAPCEQLYWPEIITAIAFASGNQVANTPGPAKYNCELSLGVTNVSPLLRSRTFPLMAKPHRSSMVRFPLF
jgi:hypothetical protein